MTKKKCAETLEENDEQVAQAAMKEQDDGEKKRKASSDNVSVPKAEFDAMRQEVDAAKAETAKMAERAVEMTTQAQRLQAEFDNYRKRTNETNKKVRIDGIVEALNGILPVLDAIEQAKAMIKDENTLNGINIIDRQLGELLKSFDVERIDALGKPFDPNLHNAVSEEDAGDDQRGNVVKVYQQGYKIGDRVLRHSVVIVGK